MKVILSQKANQKLKYYIEEINYEISGLGVVEKRKNGVLYVPDIYLFEQTVTGTETQLDPRDVDKFYDSLLEQIPQDDVEAREKMFDHIGSIKLWWHSHVDMAVFWSGTDTATQDSLDVDVDVENWWLSIVGNKKGERKAKLDIYKPHRLHLDDIQIVVEEDKELRNSIIAEIKEKVTKPTPVITVPKTNTNTYVGWGKNKHKKHNNKHSVYHPKTDDMRSMINNIKDNYRNSNGIYVPKIGAKLKNKKDK